MIIIHNSALAIDRFIANSENEQTSNELADVVHGVVAGTESADILMTILMVFLIRFDDKRIDQMADMTDNAEAFFVRKPDVPRADDDDTDDCDHENTVNQLVDVICSHMRTFTGPNTIMSCLRILRFCGVSQVELYRVLMTAAERDYSEVVRYITEQESFKDDTIADYGEDTLENPHYIKRVSASHVAVIAGLTCSKDVLDHITDCGEAFTREKDPLVLKDIMGAVRYITRDTDDGTFDIATYNIIPTPYTADANSIRYAEMAMTAIYNIAGYYGIDMETFLLRNTDFFSYDNDYRNVRDGKIIVAHDNYAASDRAMLKAMCLERMNLPLNDLSSILKLSDPYKYVNVYARNAEPYSVIVLSDWNALPCNMMPVNSLGGIKMLDYIAFLKVLADAAKVRLCLVLDMPYSQFSEKIEEELSDYYLIKYNNDAELTFGGAI